MNSRILLSALALTVSAMSMAGIPGNSNGSTMSPDGTAWRNVLSNKSFCWDYDAQYLALNTRTVNPEEREDHEVARLTWTRSRDAAQLPGTLGANVLLRLSYSGANFDFNIRGDYNQAARCWGFDIPTGELQQTVGNTRYFVKLTGIGRVGDSHLTWLDPFTENRSSTSRSIFAQVRTQAVPEPATLASLGVGAVALLRRRKRA